MKIKSVTKICNSNKAIIIHDSGSCIWIGNGFCLYPLFHFTSLTEEQVFSLLDIASDKKEKYLINQTRSIGDISLEDSVKNEEFAEMSSISIKCDGKILKPFYTKEDVIYIEEMMLAPFKDINKDDLFFFVRKVNKTTYIAVKTGFLLVGVISPSHISSKTLEELEKILAAEINKQSNE